MAASDSADQQAGGALSLLSLPWSNWPPSRVRTWEDRQAMSLPQEYVPMWRQKSGAKASKCFLSGGIY